MIIVRSQNKELLVEASNFRICEGLSEGKVAYYTIDNEHDSFTFELGKYSTKEKALKVLDKIQIAITIQLCDINRVVFQMPQDDEVGT